MKGEKRKAHNAFGCGMQKPFQIRSIVERSRFMADSFRRLLGRSLADEAENLSSEALAAYLYDAPFVLLSHTDAADPIFCYANRRAQELFGYEWSEFTRMPSRLSAEPLSLEDRERLLAQARSKGYIDQYKGVRIAKNGSRFRIENVILWNVADDQGNFVGQAAIFSHWTPVSEVLS